MDKYLVTKEEIAQLKGFEQHHFLNKNGKRVNKSLGDLTGLTGLGFQIVEVEPGYESTQLHMHHFEDECVYVLDGEAEATVGEASFRVKPGDFLGYRAGGEPHKLKNTGLSTLRYIVAGQRLDHDVCDYPTSKKRLYRNQGMPSDLVDIEHIVEPAAGRKKEQ